MAHLARSDSSRQAVARATWAVIERKGVGGASMREIAREAGCTTGVLTHYFLDKDELLLFAFTLAFESAAERMRGHVERGDDPGAVLLAVLEEALPLDAQRRVEATVYFGFHDVARRDERLGAEFRRRYALWRALLTRLITRTEAVGNHWDAEETADLLLVITDGIASSALAQPDRFTPAEQRRFLHRSVPSVTGIQVPGVAG